MIIRIYLQVRDLYQVCKELFHESITMTEKYAVFSFRRLEQELSNFHRYLYYDLILSTLYIIPLSFINSTLDPSFNLGGISLK